MVWSGGWFDLKQNLKQTGPEATFLLLWPYASAMWLTR
jgi:hypothetical protein